MLHIEHYSRSVGALTSFLNEARYFFSVFYNMSKQIKVDGNFFTSYRKLVIDAAAPLNVRGYNRIIRLKC